MKQRYYLVIALTLVLFSGCQENATVINGQGEIVDSTRLSIENLVNQIVAKQDSLVMIPSLKFAKGENETYIAKMYGENQVTLKVREEEISNEKICGRNYFYHNTELIFIKEESSIFKEGVETYTERLIYFSEGQIYKVFEKHQFTEEEMFFDTLFLKIEAKIEAIDSEKPYRALQQKGEFTMYFDEFLIIEPQSYLIVENKDKTINAALYIIEGDSVLNSLFENSTFYNGKKIWLYHSFEEMNGIERMIYEGAVLLKDD